MKPPHPSSVRATALGACFLALLVVVPGCVRWTSRPQPKAAAGVLDLRAWNFHRDGPVRLDGQWEFYWHKLPRDLPEALPGSPSADGKPPDYLPVPASWTGKRLDGDTLPADGFATYRLRVLIPPTAEPLAVRTDTAGTAFELRIDGARIAGNGSVGSDSESSRPEFRGAVTVLPALASSSEWVLAVSNFHYRKGGPWNPLWLGLAPDVARQAAGESELELFLIGSLLIMGIYHLVLFGLRPKDRSPLYYGAFCLVVALRQASTGTRILVTLAPWLPWWVLIRIEFITFFLCIALGTNFIHSLYPREFARLAARANTAAAALASLIALVTPPAWSSREIDPYQFWTLAMCAYSIWAVCVAVRRRRDGSLIFLLGTVVLVATTLNDVLYNLEIFRYRYLVAFGLVAFTFAQAVLLSRRFVGAVNTAEALQGALEVKVAERTAELTAKNLELEQAISDLRTTQSQLRKVGLSVRIGADYVVFPYAEVHYLTAHGGNTVIHTRTGEAEVARPLKEIEAMLSGEVFLRVHRQCVVNVHQIANIAHIGNGSYIAVLRGRSGSPVPVSRIHAADLKQRLGIKD